MPKNSSIAQNFIFTTWQTCDVAYVSIETARIKAEQLEVLVLFGIVLRRSSLSTMFRFVALLALMVTACSANDPVCPDNRLYAEATDGKCPWLYSWTTVGNESFCCDHVTLCKSRKPPVGNACIKPTVTFELPPEFNTDEYKYPVDSTGFYRECLHDLNCETDEYCGGGDDVKYCFKVPGYYIVPVKRCANTANCDSGYCRNRFCARPMQPYCEGQFPAVKASVECTNDADCKIDGTYCGSTDDGRKRCCATKPPHVKEGRTCNLGLMVLPRQYCVNNNTCAFGGNGLLTKWCDYDTKVCCQYNMLEPYWRYYCPDGYAPLYGQPKCSSSADCLYGPRGTEGQCVNGRCCSKLAFVERRNHFRSIPLYPFITEVPCDPARKTKWRMMYCDKTTRKMATFSQRNVGGMTQMMVKWKCSRASDCNHPNFYLSEPVCVNVTNGETYCLISPLQPTRMDRRKWYNHLGQWFRILDKTWPPVFVIMAIYSYWNYHYRNRLFYELN